MSDCTTAKSGIVLVRKLDKFPPSPHLCFWRSKNARMLTRCGGAGGGTMVNARHEKYSPNNGILHLTKVPKQRQHNHLGNKFMWLAEYIPIARLKHGPRLHWLPISLHPIPAGAFYCRQLQIVPARAYGTSSSPTRSFWLELPVRGGGRSSGKCGWKTS